MTETSPTLPPCPAWCRYRELFGGHHGFDSIHPVTGVVSRFHISDEGAVRWHFSQMEHLDPSGAVLRDPVMLGGFLIEDDLTADAARDMAAALLGGAEALDAVHGGDSGIKSVQS